VLARGGARIGTRAWAWLGGPAGFVVGALISTALRRPEALDRSIRIGIDYRRRS
jgi:hypothetical protein